MRKIGRIRDVAKETGLSIATVSRAVNEAANVNPKTRERVLRACEKLDYVPNPAAKALSTSRWRTVAAIIPTIEHSVFAKYIAAVEQTLGRSGYSLVFAISNGDQVEEFKAARKLLGMGAEAFILTGLTHSIDLIDMFERRSVPHVFTSIWNPQSDSPTIGYDNMSLAQQAVGLLASLGHRRIAAIHGPLHQNDRTFARRSGAGAAAEKHDISISFIATSLNVAGGKQAAVKLLAAKSLPTAILCFSDVLALGTYFALAKAGIRIPEDISVMGFDNLDWSEHVVPALTTIDLPARQMGAEVASQLVAHLEHSKPIQSVLLPGQILNRQSVKNIARAEKSAI